jgi:hypothetical protein
MGKRKRASDSEPAVERSPTTQPAPEPDHEAETDDIMDGHDGWAEVRPRKSQPPEDP